jgi:hypothetical protein
MACNPKGTYEKEGREEKGRKGKNREGKEEKKGKNMIDPYLGDCGEDSGTQCHAGSQQTHDLAAVCRKVDHIRHGAVTGNKRDEK